MGNKLRAPSWTSLDKKNSKEASRSFIKGRKMGDPQLDPFPLLDGAGGQAAPQVSIANVVRETRHAAVVAQASPGAKQVIQDWLDPLTKGIPGREKRRELQSALTDIGVSKSDAMAIVRAVVIQLKAEVD